MTVDTITLRSRRALLAAALGAGAATIASAIGRASPVRAADGETVLVGGEYTASSPTKFDAGASGALALWGASANATGVGVTGSSDSGNGVLGSSNSGHGVVAMSCTKCGVYANSNYNYGVFGGSAATNQPATVGRSNGNSTGVLGYSGTSTAPLPASSAKTGVYGYAAQDFQAIGVKGQTTVGTGVQGIASTGIGSRGAATTGTGVYASATTGAAILAVTSGPKSGLALRTVGRVRFDNSVGLATIAAGAGSVTVTPGIDLTATSAVVATLQGDAGGSTTVKRVVVDATADTFTIYLTANSTATVKVAWHVFG